MRFTGWTVDDIMGMLPCDDYPREAVESFSGGRERVTPREVAECEAVPLEDRIWLLVRGPWPIVARGLEAIVRRAIETHCVRCGTSVVESAALAEAAARSAALSAALSAWSVAAWSAVAAERRQQIADLLAAYEDQEPADAVAAETPEGSTQDGPTRRRRGRAICQLRRVGNAVVPRSESGVETTQTPQMQREAAETVRIRPVGICSDCNSRD